jgi:hypothetical protein
VLNSNGTYKSRKKSKFFQAAQMTDDLGEIFEGVFDNTVSKLGSSISNPVSSGKKSSYS